MMQLTSGRCTCSLVRALKRVALRQVAALRRNRHSARMEGERRAAFIERLRQEETAPFTGWDFSRIAGRMTTAPLPWSFDSLARDHLRTSRRALDLGTGGGQRLAALLGAARRLVFATEGYAANVPAPRARLAPLGGPVIAR